MKELSTLESHEILKDFKAKETVSHIKNPKAGDLVFFKK